METATEKTDLSREDLKKLKRLVARGHTAGQKLWDIEQEIEDILGAQIDELNVMLSEGCGVEDLIREARDSSEGDEHDDDKN